MANMAALEELGQQYLQLHESIKDKGCKGDCSSYWFEFYTHKMLDTTYYEFGFGGYCLGDCARRHIVRGKTIEIVVEKTQKMFEEVRRYESTTDYDTFEENFEVYKTEDHRTN